jgi:hypothetical protein
MSKLGVPPQSSTVNHTLVCNTLIQNGTKANSTIRSSGGLLFHPTQTTLADGNQPIPAAAIANGFVSIPSSGANTYTIDSAANIVARFTAIQTPLAVGDWFTVQVQNTNQAAGTVILAAGANVALAQTTTIAARASALLIFRVTSITAPCGLTVYALNSA